jgi:outer membrane protein assembly factor BamB
MRGRARWVAMAVVVIMMIPAVGCSSPTDEGHGGSTAPVPSNPSGTVDTPGTLPLTPAPVVLEDLTIGGTSVPSVPSNDPTTPWRITIDDAFGSGAMPVAIVGATVLVKGKNVLTAVDLEDGRPLWRLSGGGVGTVLAVDDSTALVVGGGSFVLVEARTGKAIWHRRQPLGSDGRSEVSNATSSGASDNVVILGSAATSGLSRSSGLRLWTSTMQGPVFVADHVVIGRVEGGVRGLDPATGAIAWSLPLPATRLDSYVVVGQHLLGVAPPLLMSWSTDTGAAEWSLPIDDTRTLVARSGSAVEWQTESSIGAFSADDGHELWRRPRGDYAAASRPTGALPAVFLHNAAKRFDVLDPATGNVTLSGPFQISSLVSTEGSFVARSQPSGSSGSVLFVTKVTG